MAQVSPGRRIAGDRGARTFDGVLTARFDCRGRTSRTGAPAALPTPDAHHRLRWDLNQLYLAMNDRRHARGLTWAGLAAELRCTPSRLTNLRTARLADMELTMRITQWLGRPAAEFVHATTW